MILVIKHNQEVVAEIEIASREDWVTVDLDGQPMLGFDCFHIEGEDDPHDNVPEPKIVIGTWLNENGYGEGEDWMRIAAKPLNGGRMIRSTGPSSL